MTKTTHIINETRRANSFEFGKAGLRHKVYYDTKAELEAAILAAIYGEEFLDGLRKNREVQL